VQATGGAAGCAADGSLRSLLLPGNSLSRQHLGWRAMLYRLNAKIEILPIVEEEVRATGWDRSDYAPTK